MCPPALDRVKLGTLSTQYLVSNMVPGIFDIWSPFLTKQKKCSILCTVSFNKGYDKDQKTSKNP